MNKSNKSTEKNLPPYFSSGEKNRIYERLAQDEEVYAKYRPLPFSEAIAKYAVEIYPVEELQSHKSLERLDADIATLDQQIGATLDNNNMTADTVNIILEGFTRQREKLMVLHRQYTAECEAKGLVVGNRPNGQRIFLGVVSPVWPKPAQPKKNPIYNGKPISLTDAINATHILVDYFEAFKNGNTLPVKPSINLSYLLRCNAITKLHNETCNLGLSGLQLKKWTLTDAQVVFTWLFAHKMELSKPLITLGNIQLGFNKKSDK